MIILRPRLNDFYNLPFCQEDVDFVIPYLDEDIPFYIDPFLLWKSPSMQDNALHLSLIESINYLASQYQKNNSECIKTMVNCSECNEVGLGMSKTKKGKRFSEKTANEILSVYKNIPQINKNGLIHLEVLQLLVDNIAEDRTSDITASIIKSFLIDFTIDSCDKYKIPIDNIEIHCFDLKDHKIRNEKVFLPINPNTKQPIIFVPKRWLRKTNYINLSNYCNDYYMPKIQKADEKPERVKVLLYNRNNYDIVQQYIEIKERQKNDCKNDLLFKQIPALSVLRKLDTLLKLPTGKSDNADKKYEDSICILLATLLYPHLDFAKEQSRTISGVSIRDLIFYNTCSDLFLKEIFDLYDCRQIVFELKNVKEVNTDHVDQLNRYLSDSFGRFGIIFTRNNVPRNVIKNTIDLWSAHRKCIIILTDEDLKLMCTVYKSKNRTPIEVIKSKYIDFTRNLPS
ncbi:MAG: hypothetical protein LBC85_09615 [Fibromonadaceae bacterium]|jgi:hypothetical protein|nr:hypothetical protein [Fibromonadaceae bacterium]